jgi:hypothetical protein
MRSTGTVAGLVADAKPARRRGHHQGRRPAYAASDLLAPSTDVQDYVDRDAAGCGVPIDVWLPFRTAAPARDTSEDPVACSTVSSSEGGRRGPAPS